jgi:hypothetical protein
MVESRGVPRSGWLAAGNRTDGGGDDDDDDDEIEGACCGSDVIGLNTVSTPGTGAETDEALRDPNPRSRGGTLLRT